MTTEEIKVDGTIVETAEVEIFRDYCFRVMRSISGSHYYLGYLVSIGPYKFDLEVYRQLSDMQAKEYVSGTLDVIALAKNWSDEDTQSGRFERRL